MVYNNRMHPQQLNIALQNWTKQLSKHHDKWTKPQQMNQAVNQTPIEQYNILLIEDQTVNQTKHA